MDEVPTFTTDADVLETVLSQLDGAVQSQGVRIGALAWLDLGSKEWAETDDKTRAAAYQAAQVTGWTEESLKDTMRQAYPHILPSVLDYTFGVLRRLSQSYPVVVESTPTTTTTAAEVQIQKITAPQGVTNEAAEEKPNG